MPQRLACLAILVCLTGCAMPGVHIRLPDVEEPIDVRVDRNRLRGMAIDPRSGDIWTALARGGVMQWSSTGQVKARFASEGALGTPPISALDGEAHDVALAPDGTVWVAGARGAARRAPDGTWSHIDVPLPSIDPGPATSDDPYDQSEQWPGRALQVAVDPTGSVWFGGLYGVVGLAPDGDWERAPWPTDYGYKVGNIRVAPNGDVWIGTLYMGVHVRRADGTWQSWETVGSPPQTRVWDVGFLPDGQVLALHGTDSGHAIDAGSCLLSILDDDQRWSFDAITLPGLQPNGLAHRLAVDAAGRVWVAMQDGRFLVPDAAATRSWHIESVEVYYAEGSEDMALDAAGTPWFTGDLGLFHRRADGTIDHFDRYDP